MARRPPRRTVQRSAVRSREILYLSVEAKLTLARVLSVLIRRQQTTSFGEGDASAEENHIAQLTTRVDLIIGGVSVRIPLSGLSLLVLVCVPESYSALRYHQNVALLGRGCEVATVDERRARRRVRGPRGLLVAAGVDLVRDYLDDRSVI
jgi:hypothetical protein